MIVDVRSVKYTKTMASNYVCPVCHEDIKNPNSCAHQLSQAFGWKKIPGCVAMCKCGYPVLANEVRSIIFSGSTDTDKKAEDFKFIYCRSGGQGHVYYGSYMICAKGNGYTAHAWEKNLGKALDEFVRYSSAKF
jgi:hypothetical protein